MNMKQLKNKDYDVITNYFVNNFNKNFSKYFCDPYINEATEFSAFVIKDSLFNYSSLFYTNEENTEMICFRLRKKPINSLIIDLIYFDFDLNENFIEKFNFLFNDIKLKYENIGKVNICLNEENINKLVNSLQELNFSCEVIYYDEFGLGNNVLVYSRYL